MTGWQAFWWLLFDRTTPAELFEDIDLTGVLPAFKHSFRVALILAFPLTYEKLLNTFSRNLCCGCRGHLLSDEVVLTKVECTHHALPLRHEHKISRVMRVHRTHPRI